MRECMTDAGCSAAAIERAEHLYQAGDREDLIRCLRVCRCDALEKLHAQQKQLDRLDGLIRSTQKRTNGTIQRSETP